MNKTVVSIVAIVVLGLVGGGAYALIHNSKKTSTTTTTNTTTPTPQSNTPAPTTPQTTANTIDYTSSGFSPATLTVKAGSTLTIKNSSSGILQFDSNPHPQHTDDPEINVGSISPGQSKTITVTKTGSHGYHNHLSPSDTGLLIVE